MNKILENSRILAVSLSARGFGYAVMEGDAIVGYGNKVIIGDKNAKILAHIRRMIVRNQPDMLIRQDVSAKEANRRQRIKSLDQDLEALAKQNNLETRTISGSELRRLLLGNQNGTKHQMAERVAAEFPDELGSRLPQKRKSWDSEDARMDIFSAVGLALVHRHTQKSSDSLDQI